MNHWVLFWEGNSDLLVGDGVKRVSTLFRKSSLTHIFPNPRFLFVDALDGPTR